MTQSAPDPRCSRCLRGILPFVAVLFVAMFISCTQEDEIRLPETSRLIGRESTALVRVEYARLYADPDPASPIVTHARIGDILPVLRRTPDGRWLAVRAPLGEGWVFHDDTALYQTEAQARNARGQLRLREDS
jgi:hypothetical protein